MTRNEQIAEHVLYDAYLARDCERPTMRPPTYPELEREVLRSLEEPGERETEPPPTYRSCK